MAAIRTATVPMARLQVGQWEHFGLHWLGYVER